MSVSYNQGFPAAFTNERPTMKIYLNPPQTEIVRLICLGCTNKEVGAILDIPPSRVENHKAAAMQALGTDKDAQLSDLAMQHQVIKLNDVLTNREKRLCGRTQ